MVGPIIDPHHHLWDLGLGRHPWLAPRAGHSGGLGDLARLRQNYLPTDYLRDAADHNIVATCPSSDDLRQFGCFRKGGSGSSVVEIKRHAGDAANDDLRWSGV